jgi:hypothetical protein
MLAGSNRPALIIKPLGHKRVTAAERKRRQRNLLPHLKIFLQKRLLRKGYPLFLGQTVFGQVFGRGGMSNFQNPKVPPTRGVASATRTLLSIKGGSALSGRSAQVNGATVTPRARMAEARRQNLRQSALARRRGDRTRRREFISLLGGVAAAWPLLGAGAEWWDKGMPVSGSGPPASSGSTTSCAETGSRS